MTSPTMRVPRCTTLVGRALDGALPHTTGKGVPSDFDGLALLQAANLRLVDEGAHADVVQIGDLYQKIAGGDKSVFADRQVISHAGMRRKIFRLRSRSVAAARAARASASWASAWLISALEKRS